MTDFAADITKGSRIRAHWLQANNPLTDNIYVILAQWDLTPIEQAILEDRL